MPSLTLLAPRFFFKPMCFDTRFGPVAYTVFMSASIFGRFLGDIEGKGGRDIFEGIRRFETSSTYSLENRVSLFSTLKKFLGYRSHGFDLLY